MADPKDPRLLLEQYGAHRVIQSALKTHPQYRSDIMSLVRKLGVDGAAEYLLRPRAGAREPASAPLAQPSRPAPPVQAASQAIRAMSQAAMNLQTKQQGVNPVGVGAAQPLSFDTTTIDQPQPTLEVPEPLTTPAVEPARVEQQVEQPIEEAPLPDPNLQTVERPSIRVALPKSLKIPTREYITNTSDFGDLCQSYGFTMPFVLSVIKQESGFDPGAASHRNAKGLMQLMPDTARDMGLTVTTKVDERMMPRKNLSAGIKYLQWIKNTFKTKTMDELLAGYNAGPSRLKDGNWKKINETNRYIKKIKGNMSAYKKQPDLMASDLNKLFANLRNAQ